MGVFLLLETFADSCTVVKDPNTLKTAHFYQHWTANILSPKHFNL